MATRLRILILEDIPSDVELLLHELRLAGFAPEWQCVTTESEYLAALAAPPDVILADYSLPQFDARSALCLLHEREMDIPFLVVSGVVGDEEAVSILKLGAADYLLKDRLARLGQAVAQALEQKRLRDEKQRTEEALQHAYEELETSVQERTAALQASEAQLRLVLEAAPASIVYVDQEQHYRFCNQRYAKNFDLNPRDMVDKHVQEVLGVKNYQQIRPHIEQALAGQLVAFEVEVSFPRIGKRYLNVVYAPDRDPNGLVRGFVGMVSDTTERKEAEKMRAHLAEIVHSSADAIVSKDLQGIITSWNPAAEQIYGYTAEEMIGQSKSRIIPPDLPEELPTILNKIRAGERIEHYETVRLRKGGTRVNVSITVSPIRDGSGQIIGASNIARDITERKLAEAERERLLYEVEKQRARLQVVLENTPGGVAILEGPEHRYTMVNPAHGVISRGKGDLVGRTVAEVWSEARGHEAQQLLDRVFTSGEPVHYTEMRMELERDQGREEAFFNLDYLPLRDEKGQVFGILLFANEITELVQSRKRAQALAATLQEMNAELAASETLFRAIFELAAVGIARVAPDGSWLDVNHKLCEIVGYTREEMLAKTFQDITHPEDLNTDLAYIRQMLAGEIQSYSVEKRFFHKDGSIVWINLTVTLVRESGQPKYFISVVEDITANKRAEEALRRSEAYTRAIVNVALDGIATINEQGVIESFNLAAAHTFGYEPEEVIGQNIKILMPEPYHSEHDAYLHNYLTTGQKEIIGIGREVRGRKKDGTIFPIELAVSEVALENRRVFVGTLRDITQRKRAEEALLQAQALLEERVLERTAELQRSNADLQQFAYVASHDLQEPLRMVTSFMQLLEKKYKGQLDEQAHVWIGYAVDGASRMQKLINDLLVYSRVGTHGKEFRRCDVNEVLYTALQNLQLTLSENNAEITFDALPIIQGDGLQLVSLFQNLIGNAIKYHSDLPPRIHITASREGQEWLFSVRDNGIGIAPQFSERIFIIFQRLHNRNAYPGTGIGLALCKRIVERHGGRIWVESESGQGATFFFVLPAKHKETGREKTGYESTGGDPARGG
ncbi:MAG TPA: PAS domain S-box protein [Chthonomonadaceae bacterium]|nr:PAS domain S-box protein [Chthonomonadaceae bacterium]